MKKSLAKLKNRFIKQLGGYTEQEMAEWRIKARSAEHKVQKLEAETIAVDKNCDYWANRCNYIESRITTVQTAISLSDHPAWSEENIAEHARELVIRNLGKAVYKHAVHTVDDGIYVVGVMILRKDEEK